MYCEFNSLEKQKVEKRRINGEEHQSFSDATFTANNNSIHSGKLILERSSFNVQHDNIFRKI